MNPQMGEESRDERCQGSTARWKVGSDEVMDKQLRTKAVKSTLLICSDYLMLCNKLPHNLVGIKQPYAFGSGKLGIQTGHSRKGLSLILDVWAIMSEASRASESSEGSFTVVGAGKTQTAGSS